MSDQLPSEQNPLDSLLRQLANDPDCARTREYFGEFLTNGESSSGTTAAVATADPDRPALSSNRAVNGRS